MKLAHIIGVAALLGVGLTLGVGCAEPAPSGPQFAVTFDSSLARSVRDEAARVELYVVQSCDDLTLGERPVPAFANTFSIRDGQNGSFGDVLMPGSYALYGVAQDFDCAVVAAGCASIEITGGNETLAVVLSAIQGQGCAADKTCALQTGTCVDGTGGTGGGGGAGGMGGGPGNPRVDDGLILLYSFDEGSGSTVFDESFVLPAHDLTIADADRVSWSEGFLTVDQGTVLSTAGAATKITARAQASGELTIEAWVKAANVTQGGPSRIVSMSTDPYMRNFMLGQEANTFAARFRAEGQSDWDNGSPTIFTSSGSVTTSLIHVVFTHSASGEEIFYVDGVVDLQSVRTGGLSQWDASYPLIVANEATADRDWLGELHLIAVYERALSSGEVLQNFAAGP